MKPATAPDDFSTSGTGTFRFGAFTLIPAQEALLDDGKLVQIGSRALRLLAVLVESEGKLVSRNELMAKVWPNTVVEEGNLTVHIGALRRVLGAGQPNARYIATVPGQGYQFVATVEKGLTSPFPANPSAAAASNLPALVTKIIGRQGPVESVILALTKNRIVTITGTAGIGKTTVGIAAANRVRDSYRDGVVFADLASVAESKLIPTTLAAALSIVVRSSDVLSTLVEALKSKQVLLVLDSCEHLVEAVSVLVEAVARNASEVCVLATSREPLRVYGEHVHRLPPLPVPPESPSLSAAEAATFAAVQLFHERARASLDSFELDDPMASTVAGICRRLDGIPLAIELIAGQIAEFGVHGLTRLLDDRFRLLTRGMRTSLPRHQTLTTALDWSYRHIPEGERTILRELSVFVGNFTLEAAIDVVRSQDAQLDAVDTIANLVAKSLVTANVDQLVAQYRLLDTTRAYATEKLKESGEFASTQRRHAKYFRDRFERAKLEYERLEIGEWRKQFVSDLGNVRAALEWAFSSAGDAEIGVSLAAAVVPLFLEMSLLSECQSWAETALARIGRSGRYTRQELELRHALGVTFSFTKGNGPELRAALEGALQLAVELDDSVYQYRILSALYMSCLRSREFQAALVVANRAVTLAKTPSGQAHSLMADWMLVDVNHFLGNHAEVKAHCLTVLRHDTATAHASTVWSGIDPRVHASHILSRTLWLMGFPDQAKVQIQKTVAIAEGSEHPISICLPATWCAPLLMYMGDLDTAADYLARLDKVADEHRLASYQAVALGLKGELVLRRGDPKNAIDLVRAGIARFREIGHTMVIVPLLGVLSEAFAASQAFTDSFAAIDEAIALAEASGEWLHYPELLRIKGEILRAASPDSPVDRARAEDIFVRALDEARRVSALSWELRAATSLAQLASTLGRDAEAHSKLSGTYGKFVEGFDTADLRRAKSLLDGLRPSKLERRRS